MSGKYSAEWWAQFASVTGEWVRKNDTPRKEASEQRKAAPAEKPVEAAA
jgi:hypothetical protein